ncbi:MAG: hypothetical protein ACM3PU_05290 [Gemmatimonadota bacterium]
MNANPDFAKVQSAFLNGCQQTRQCLPQFGGLRDGTDMDKKYVLPDLAGQGRRGIGQRSRFAKGSGNQACSLIGAIAPVDQGGGRRFRESLSQGFAGVHWYRGGESSSLHVVAASRSQPIPMMCRRTDCADYRRRSTLFARDHANTDAAQVLDRGLGGAVDVRFFRHRPVGRDA